MKWYENELKTLEKQGFKVVNSQWDDRRTIKELDFIFFQNNRNFSVKPPKSCECKTIILEKQQKILFDAVV